MPVAEGGVFGGLGYKPLGWPSLSDNAVVDNAIGSTPASDPSVFGVGTGQGFPTGTSLSNPAGYNLPGVPSAQGTFNLGSTTSGPFSTYMSPEGRIDIPQSSGFSPLDTSSNIPADTSPNIPSDTSSGNVGTDTSSGNIGTDSSGNIPADSSGNIGTDSSSSGSSSIPGGGGGSGMPIDVGLQSSTTQFISGQTQQIEQSFGGEAQKMLTAAQSAIGTTFAGISDTLLRGILIALGIIIAFIALWRIMFPDQFKEMMAAMPRLAAA
jgi:hypothetical protein